MSSGIQALTARTRSILSKCQGYRSSITRRLSTHVEFKRNLDEDFVFVPNFLDGDEQKILLAASLKLLDSSESGLHRRRRRKLEASCEGLGAMPSTVQSMFLSDESYQFEEGHYDGVIHHFREMHVPSWPVDTPGLQPVINRIHAVCPTKDIQTHIVHLASTGEILPHIDNIHASGSWILGVSLGADRILCMRHFEDANDTFKLLLPSGSLYIQRHAMRFNYKHSILRAGTYEGRQLPGGQRLSVMIRDRLAAECCVDRDLFCFVEPRDRSRINVGNFKWDQISALMQLPQLSLHVIQLASRSIYCVFCDLADIDAPGETVTTSKMRACEPYFAERTRTRIHTFHMVDLISNSDMRVSRAYITGQRLLISGLIEEEPNGMVFTVHAAISIENHFNVHSLGPKMTAQRSDPAYTHRSRKRVILLRTFLHEGQTSKHLFAEPRKMTTSETWGDASNHHQTLPMLRVVGDNSNVLPLANCHQTASNQLHRLRQLSQKRRVISPTSFVPGLTHSSVYSKPETRGIPPLNAGIQ